MKMSQEKKTYTICVDYRIGLAHWEGDKAATITKFFIFPPFTRLVKAVLRVFARTTHEGVLASVVVNGMEHVDVDLTHRMEGSNQKDVTHAIGGFTNTFTLHVRKTAIPGWFPCDVFITAYLDCYFEPSTIIMIPGIGSLKLDELLLYGGIAFLFLLLLLLLL